MSDDIRVVWRNDAHDGENVNAETPATIEAAERDAPVPSSPPTESRAKRPRDSNAEEVRRLRNINTTDYSEYTMGIIIPGKCTRFE